MKKSTAGVTAALLAMQPACVPPNIGCTHSEAWIVPGPKTPSASGWGAWATLLDGEGYLLKATEMLRDEDALGVGVLVRAQTQRALELQHLSISIELPEGDMQMTDSSLDAQECIPTICPLSTRPTSVDFVATPDRGLNYQLVAAIVESAPPPAITVSIAARGISDGATFDDKTRATFVLHERAYNCVLGTGHPPRPALNR